MVLDNIDQYAPMFSLVQDHINNWRVTALMLTSVLLIAAGIWFIGILYSLNASESKSLSLK